MAMVSAVEREIGMDLLIGAGRTLPVGAALCYCTDSPFQVRIIFREHGESIATWVFCRELLLEGAHQPAGQGDVRVWPDHGSGERMVYLALSSPDGSSLLRASACEIAEWNELVCRTVPLGTEHRHIDLDREVAALLAG